MDLDLIISIVSFLVLVFLGIPVVFSLGASTLIWMALNIQAMPVMNALPQNMMTYMMRFTFIAMPCFILVGRMMNKTGVTDRLSDFAVAVVGRFRGGLAYSNVFSSMLFATMSGNAVSDAGGIGYVQMKMMKDAGYDLGFAAGTTASSSVLGPIIPPSQIMVLLGSIAEISVARLFLGGIVPGAILTAAFMLLIYVRAHFTVEGRKWPVTKVPLRETIKTIPRVIPPMLTFVIIMGSIMAGICTPTEAAVLAVWWAFFLGICYRKVTLKGLWDALGETVESCGIFMLLVSVASFFAWIVTIERVHIVIGQVLAALSAGNIYVMYFICVLIFLIIGCFIDTGSAALLLTPILFPAVEALGIDLVHFSLVMILSLMVGLITPPFGLVLFVVADCCGLPFSRVAIESLKYAPAMLLVIILIIFFPDLVLFLPKIFFP